MQELKTMERKDSRLGNDDSCYIGTEQLVKLKSTVTGEGEKMNLLDFQLQLSISPDRIWKVLGALNCV